MMACEESATYAQKYHGNDWIDMRESSIDSVPVIDNIIIDNINKFTQIGNSDWFNHKNGKIAGDEEKPDFDSKRFCPNHACFLFVFLPDGHRMFFITSLIGKKISQALLAKSLQDLFNRPLIIAKYDEIAVNIEMNKRIINKILKLRPFTDLLYGSICLTVTTWWKKQKGGKRYLILNKLAE